MRLPTNTYSAFGLYPEVSLQSIGGEWPSFDCIIDLQNDRGLFGISACSSLNAEELDAFQVSSRHRFESEFSAYDAEYKFICVNNATIIGDTGAIINDNGELLLESLFPSFRPHALKIIQESPSFATCLGQRDFNEDVFVLFDGGGFNNYWHFHVDMLPTVSFTRSIHLASPVKFAMPQRRQWHSAALKRLAVDESEIVQLQNQYNKFRRIFVFSSIYWPELTIPNSIARKTFGALKRGRPPEVDDSKTNNKKLLYIARTDSAARKMTNEHELIDSMRLLGFDIAVMSGLEYEEQVALFRSSDVIVSPHGAGLTNAIYCDSKSLVIEIFPFGILNAPHYNFLCKALGIDYEMFVSQRPSEVSVHQSWALEIEDFLFRLICMLSDRQMADRDVLLAKLAAFNDNTGWISAGEHKLSDLFGSNMITLFGFSGMEDWGSWVCERRGAILFQSRLPEQFTLRMKIIVNIPALSQPLMISCGKTRYQVSSSSDEVVFNVDNPAGLKTIWIDAPGATRAKMPPSSDTRMLSIGIATICFEVAPD